MVTTRNTWRSEPRSLLMSDYLMVDYFEYENKETYSGVCVAAPDATGLFYFSIAGDEGWEGCTVPIDVAVKLAKYILDKAEVWQ